MPAPPAFAIGVRPLASANRDPRAVRDPDRFDLGQVSLEDQDIVWTARMGHRWPEALNLTLEDSGPSAGVD